MLSYCCVGTSFWEYPVSLRISWIKQSLNYLFHSLGLYFASVPGFRPFGGVLVLLWRLWRNATPARTTGELGKGLHEFRSKLVVATETWGYLVVEMFRNDQRGRVGCICTSYFRDFPIQHDKTQGRNPKDNERMVFKPPTCILRV